MRRPPLRRRWPQHSSKNDDSQNRPSRSPKAPEMAWQGQTFSAPPDPTGAHPEARTSTDVLLQCKYLLFTDVVGGTFDRPSTATDQHGQTCLSPIDDRWSEGDHPGAGKASILPIRTPMSIYV